MGEEKTKELRQKSGAPLKVLSTSLGVALAANLLMVPGGVKGETAGTDQPKLVEWSSDAVKQYFDAGMDWNIPIPGQGGAAQPSPSQSSAAGSGGNGGSAAPVVIHNGGFGWDDLLLYHLIFNRGGSYSSSSWSNRRPVYDPRTNQPYKSKSYSAGTFENKPVEGSNVKPKTSASTGSFNSKPGTSSSSAKSGSSSSSVSSSSSSSSSSKSTSSSSGSIGGKSSGFSSSSGS